MTRIEEINTLESRRSGRHEAADDASMDFRRYQREEGNGYYSGASFDEIVQVVVLVGAP